MLCGKPKPTWRMAHISPGLTCCDSCAKKMRRKGCKSSRSVSLLSYNRTAKSYQAPEVPLIATDEA